MRGGGKWPDLRNVYRGWWPLLKRGEMGERQEKPRRFLACMRNKPLSWALSYAVLFARQHAVLYLACASSVGGEQTRTLLLQEARPHQGRGGVGHDNSCHSTAHAQPPTQPAPRFVCVLPGFFPFSLSVADVSSI